MARFPGPGGLSASRIGRGLLRPSGRFAGAKFQFAPDWERQTKKAVEPQGDKLAKDVHEHMDDAMHIYSRRRPGGGTERTEEGWAAGIGSPPKTHTHWHLIEFGGGRHYARAPVRNRLRTLGQFVGSGRS